MDAHKIQLVRASLPMVAAIAPQAARLFCGRLFDLDPSGERLFHPALTKSQGTKLMAGLGFVVAHLDRPERLLPVTRDMAVRHVDYGVRRDHYIPVGEALFWTLEQGLGATFTPELRAAWTEACATLASVMSEAAYTEMAA